MRSRADIIADLSSIPSKLASDVTTGVLPGSPLPGDLRAVGEHVTEIVEKFIWGVDGEMEPATVGSTMVIAETRTHAGIVRVHRYGFSMP
jgi:hypothetical protein